MNELNKEIIYDLIIIVPAIIAFMWSYILTKNIWFGLYFTLLFGVIAFIGIIAFVLITDKPTTQKGARLR